MSLFAYQDESIFTHTRAAVECLDCHHLSPYSLVATTCPRCGGQWFEARYPYASIAPSLPGATVGRPNDLWRYKEVLPLKGPNPLLTMGEGGTPFLQVANLGMMLGSTNIFVKDERQGPTHSFKDRQAALSVAALKEAGITEFVLASTGNVAISYSAFAARAGIKLWAFLTSLVPGEKMREVAIYGTQVVKVTASYDTAKSLAAEFARQRGLYLERGSRSVTSVEAMKTIAYEISEQLANSIGAPPVPRRTDSPYPSAPPWRAPDWYIQPVSGGLGPQGVLKGFEELYEMGLIDKIPALACIQTEGCAPMVRAWKQGLKHADPIPNPRTHIATLSTGDPGRTYTWLWERMQRAQDIGAGGGGVFEMVSDEEAFRTIHIIAKMEGLSIEPASAVGFAGMIKLVRAGIIKPNEIVAINCTGHTMPIEKEILGENWARTLAPSVRGVESAAATLQHASIPDSPEEGLLAALSRVTSERFPRVLVVDDTPDARRLILRILQSQGNYTLFEAANGRDAIRLAQHELPDLVILDLMMPEVDGFAVLDALKNDPQTQTIPVIVVTAKELTNDEKRRLAGRIHLLMQKGSFMGEDLSDEVKSLLRED
jgi:threonine synthase